MTQHGTQPGTEVGLNQDSSGTQLGLNIFHGTQPRLNLGIEFFDKFLDSDTQTQPIYLDYSSNHNLGLKQDSTFRIDFLSGFQKLEAQVEASELPQQGLSISNIRFLDTVFLYQVIKDLSLFSLLKAVFKPFQELFEIFSR